MRRIYCSLASIGIALALPSCLDSEEEVWIHADASGAARISITVPAAATSLHGGEAGVKALAEDFLKSSPAFTSYQVETSTVGKRTTVDASFTFADVRDFLDRDFAENLDHLPGAGGEFAGMTEVEFQGGNIVFSRRTDLSKAIPGVMFIPQQKLAGHKVKTIIHLPKAATSHNATSTAGDGRTLIWSTPLSAALKSPVVMTFTMPIPIPWVPIALAALAVLILIAALLYYLRSRKPSPAIPSPSPDHYP